MARWPHAPMHLFEGAALVMVTAGTYQKEHFFGNADRLARLHDLLHELSEEHGFKLQAWAVFSNHYHFIAEAEDKSANLSKLAGRLHSITSKEVNAEDGAPGRKVWHQYWDSNLTFPRATIARLNYVHQNPVKHGLVRTASDYPWCSARWFEETARQSFVESVYSVKIDKVKVPDDF